MQKMPIKIMIFISSLVIFLAASGPIGLVEAKTAHQPVELSGPVASNQAMQVAWTDYLTLVDLTDLADRALENTESQGTLLSELMQINVLAVDPTYTADQNTGVERVTYHYLTTDSMTAEEKDAKIAAIFDENGRLSTLGLVSGTSQVMSRPLKAATDFQRMSALESVQPLIVGAARINLAGSDYDQVVLPVTSETGTGQLHSLVYDSTGSLVYQADLPKEVTQESLLFEMDLVFTDFIQSGSSN